LGLKKTICQLLRQDNLERAFETVTILINVLSLEEPPLRFNIQSSKKLSSLLSIVSLVVNQMRSCTFACAAARQLHNHQHAVRR
jgi:hypothetical protein